MIAPSRFARPSILIVKADRLQTAGLHLAAQTVFPTADFAPSSRLETVTARLAAGAFDLLLAGVGLPGGDMLDLLARCAHPPRSARSVLIITGRREAHVLLTLRGLGIGDVFDSTDEEPGRLKAALRMVAEGGCYWTPGVLRHLQQIRADPHAVHRLLSPTEQWLFAVLGDGCDDEEAVERTGLKLSTIASGRRELHRRLGVQQRGELVQRAVRHGCVRFTAEGVVRPGFELLARAAGRGGAEGFSRKCKPPFTPKLG